MSYFSFLSFLAFFLPVIMGAWRNFYQGFCSLIKRWRKRKIAASPLSWKRLTCATLFLRRILVVRFAWNGSIFTRLASIH